MSYTIPIGPYHPSLEEPVHARLTVDGEQITDAKVFIGYNHRGIEKLAQERNFIQTDVLVERVCGICSHSHAMTYAMCVENIAGMEVPKRGQYIRVIISELERIHSHLLWLGIACHIIGHDSLFMHTWNDRERTMDLLEAITGNRVNYAMNTIGGARRDIDDAKRKMILDTLDDLEVKMSPLTSFLTTDKTVAMRTQGSRRTDHRGCHPDWCSRSPRPVPPEWTLMCAGTRPICPMRTSISRFPWWTPAMCSPAY